MATLKVYPELDSAVTDPKYGNQRLAAEYVPVALDSESAAATRMLAAVAAKKSREEVIAAGLNGSDEVKTVSDVLDGILAEAKAWDGVSPCDFATVTTFKAALKGKYLDPTAWYDALKVQAGVSSFSDLKAVIAATLEPVEV